MLEALDQARKVSHLYEQTNDLSLWFQANELYLQVEMELQKHPVFSLLMQDSSILLKATVLRTEDWSSHKTYFDKINTLLNDISLFHTVIISFTDRLIMPMESLTQSNISEAVQWLTEYHYPIYYPEEKRGIGYPYHFNKPITLSFHSREIASETGEYEIIETYTIEELLMLLKIDFLSRVAGIRWWIAMPSVAAPLIFSPSHIRIGASSAIFSIARSYFSMVESDSKSSMLSRGIASTFKVSSPYLWLSDSYANFLVGSDKRTGRFPPFCV
jgi:hypothetical protein